MTIRVKIIYIVLPLIIGPLIITGYISATTARLGLTEVTTDLLEYKAEELDKYCLNQWDLLTENKLESNSEFINVSKTSIQSFASNMIRSSTELIFAVTADCEVEVKTSDFVISDKEEDALKLIIDQFTTGWNVITIEGVERVAQVIYFEPFDWFIFVTESRDVFYHAVNQIMRRTILIIMLSMGAAVALMLVFAGLLTMPLRRVVSAMKDIITSNDLSRKVELLYHDETGELANTFNIMTEALDKAYSQIKIYALESAIAQKKEQKIRNIFQKYVPKDVIDRYFNEPEGLMEGEDRILAVLFSDIREFTTISERMRPSEIVESLNSYFSAMVDIIMEHKGIVDKYIGDAIMAFYGAPVKHEDDAYLALSSAFEMQKALSFFNSVQRSRNAPEFRIGIGINYGIVTVGNIGSEKKMDYTVVGDMVNLASRLEGLTKVYKEPIIFSESIYRQVMNYVPCRMLDRVVVKGRDISISIYTAKEKVESREQIAWEKYHNGLYHFYDRRFKDAVDIFEQVLQLLPDDFITKLFLERSRIFLNNPPNEDWTGEMHLGSK